MTQRYNGPIVGFIGTGSMGGALAKAVSRRIPGERMLLANRSPEKAEALAQELHACTTENENIAWQAGWIFLGVKPQGMAEMCKGISQALREREERFILVSMAAGLSVRQIQEMAEGDYPVIRIMPNTPSAVGEGMNLYHCGPGIAPEEERQFLEMMEGSGRLVPIPEKLMDASAAVAGCGPAFVDLFLEALADGGVACGLPRALAMELAAQMTLGSAKLLLETGQHPGQLKDAVCSPGGSTIQGVRKLEAAGLRGAVMEAVIAAYEKSNSIDS